MNPPSELGPNHAAQPTTARARESNSRPSQLKITLNKTNSSKL